MSKTHSNIPYSVLDLAVITEGQKPADAIANSRDLAQHVEQWGYKRFWMAEHHNMENIASSATSVLIGHVAEATETLRVGSGGVMLPNHSPLIIAEHYGTLATMYPNRIDLGLGRAPGTDQSTAQAIRSDRRAAVHQFPQNVQKLQQYFSDNNSQHVQAIPGKGTEVPLWILGSSTDSAQLAGSLGLPYVFASHFAPQQLMSALKVYHENFEPSKQLDEPYVIPCINIVAADSDDEAEYLATSLMQMFMGVVTGDRSPMPPPVENMNEVWGIRERAAVQQMLACTFIGSKNSIRQEVEDFVERTAADELMIASYLFDHEKRLKSHRLFAEIMQEV